VNGGAWKSRLEEKGYSSSEYRLDGNILHLKLRPGIYPHNMIGIRYDGTLISVTIRGLSNRVGVTLEEAAEIMSVLGSREALILDNGNDVFVNFCGDFFIGAEEG
jgi:exopolysaccharide biosynthesis protein